MGATEEDRRALKWFYEGLFPCPTVHSRTSRRKQMKEEGFLYVPIYIETYLEWTA
ncbi:hypothetical protein CCONF_07975 [Corynebacterium confusum]|nr:hypothetical protein CCONF_07975 [Corynebacterium confusum]